MAEPTAHIDVLAIPDRMEQGRPRLCIQLAPSLSTCLGGTVKLADWPAAMALRASEMRVWRARLVAGVPTDMTAIDILPADIAALAALPSKVPGKSVGARALDKWREIFAEPGFDVLRQALAGSGAQPVAACVQAGTAIGITSAKTALLDRLLDNSLARSIEGDRMRSALLPGASPIDVAQIASRADLAALAGIARETARLASARWFDTKTKFASLESELVGTCAARGGDILPGGNHGMRALDALGHMAAILQADEPPSPTENAPADSMPSDTEIAMRKLNTLLAFPTLAKYFGLCADILLPANAFGDGNATGVIAVELKEPGTSFGPPPDAAKLNWTAFACRVPQGRTLRQFTCWDGDGARAADDPLSALDKKLHVDGLLNLRHEVSGARSFHLGSGEVINTLLRINEKTPADAQAGSAIDAADKALAVNRKTKGILLYREHASEQFALTSRREAVRFACGSEALTINYADELDQGIRLDVQLLPDPGPRNDKRWRPLMMRSVQFDTRDVDANFLGDARVYALQYRDEGAASAPVAEIPSAGKTLFVVSEEVASWGGGSLGISSTNSKVPLDPATDVAIGVTFALREGEANGRYLPPPFRTGRRYAIRARTALPLGCGITFDDLQADPGDEGHTLPDQQGFDYRRYEQIGAPLVCFRSDHSLVTTKGLSATSGALKRDGRTIEQMVVRANEAAFGTDTRYLLPPRVSLDEAEQQGQFDTGVKAGVKAPPGAFEAAAAIALYGPEGQLPEARAGAVTWYDSDADRYVAEQPSTIASADLAKAQTRGTVLLLDPAARQRQQDRWKNAGIVMQRYYPDRYSRDLIIALKPVEHFSIAPVTTGGQRVASFWSSAERPWDAKPIMIQLVRAVEDPGKPASISEGTTSIKLADGSSLEIAKVSVALQPGEIMDLELFADPSTKDFQKNHHGAATVADPGNYRPNSAWSIARKELCHVRTVRLVHAVPKPLTAPQFETGPNGLDLRGVTRTVRPEDAEAGPPKWSDIANSGRPITSEEGGGTTFFLGHVTLHGRTTAELRCDARWKDFGEDSIKRDPKDQSWVLDTPLQYAQLFQIKPIASEKAPLRIDLLRDDGELRGLSHAFTDGRARRLQVRLVATSRFTDYYPEAKDDGDIESVGAFEKASNGFSGQHEIWTDCTFRPPAPVVDRILPILDWELDRISDRLTFARRSWLRVFLDSRWYASGEGEKLALVFDRAKRSVCKYETDELIPFAPYLTRWGRDPIRLTRHVELIRPADFEGANKEVGDLFLHAETSPGGNAPPLPLPVTILPFEPVTDTKLGLYCDIRFARPQGALFSYMPFLQLGLARYQPHAAATLELSHAVQETVQILPDRLGYVELQSQKKIRVVVSGPGFGKREDTYHRMRLDVRVMQRDSAAGEQVWRPTKGSDGRDLFQVNQIPNGKTDDELWAIDIDLPERRDQVHYAVLIEEYELLPADPVSLVEDAPRGADPLEGTELVRRGPLFQVTIDLRMA